GLLFSSPRAERPPPATHSAAAAGQAAAAARTSNALRHHDNVAAPQADVLLEVLATRDRLVVERQQHALALLAADHLDVLLDGERPQAAGHGERLQHVDEAPGRVVAGLVDAAEHVDPVARHLDHQHRDDRIGNVLGDARRDLVAHLGDAAAAGL